MIKFGAPAIHRAQFTIHRHNSSPAQLTAGTIHRSTVHRGTIHRAQFTAAQFTAYYSPRKNKNFAK
jgi:hypothetical protein